MCKTSHPQKLIFSVFKLLGLSLSTTRGGWLTEITAKMTTFTLGLVWSLLNPQRTPQFEFWVHVTWTRKYNDYILFVFNQIFGFKQQFVVINEQGISNLDDKAPLHILQMHGHVQMQMTSWHAGAMLTNMWQKWRIKLGNCCGYNFETVVAKLITNK